MLSAISNIEYAEDQVEDIYFGRDVEIVRSKNTQWYLHVPIAFESGKVSKSRVFADPGANTPCIDTDFAQQHFPNMISKIKTAKQVHVPGGWIKPKYCLWMSFPTKKGSILKSKFLLVNNLPVKILLDINILKAFGYHFREETPEIFRHSEKEESDDELLNFGDHLTNHQVNKLKHHNWFSYVTQQKMHQVNNEDMYGNDDNRVTLYDKVQGDGDLLYPRTEIIITSEGEKDNLNLIFNGPPIDDSTPNDTTINDVTTINLILDNYPNTEFIDPQQIPKEHLIPITPTIDECKNIVNNLNTQAPNNNKPTKFKRILMLMPKYAF